MRLPGICTQPPPPSRHERIPKHSHRHTLKKATAISRLSISKSGPSPQLHHLPVYNSGDKSPLGRTNKEKTNGEVGREGEGERDR